VRITLERDGFEASVDLDVLERQIDAGTRAVTRRILDEFRLRAQSIYTDAREAWPVGDRGRPHDKKGPHSRDMLRLDVRLNIVTGDARATVTSPAPYTRFIGAGTSKRGKPIVSEKAREGAERVQPAGYRGGAKAAQRGMVRWTLLGWPERWHARELVRGLGPELERAMQREVDR
jgi:hypothetical protein